MRAQGYHAWRPVAAAVTIVPLVAVARSSGLTTTYIVKIQSNRYPDWTDETDTSDRSYAAATIIAQYILKCSVKRARGERLSEELNPFNPVCPFNPNCSCLEFTASAAITSVLSAKSTARDTVIALPSDPLRSLLFAALAWQDAHATFDAAVADIPPDMRGLKAPGLPYSPWQLLEHLRRTQHDILDFCVNPAYKELHWPDDYWPVTSEPPSPGAWDECIAGYKKDLAELQHIAADSSIDLFAKIPHGSGQTYARELVLVIDHNAYHVGQLIAVRRVLGAWPG